MILDQIRAADHLSGTDDFRLSGPAFVLAMRQIEAIRKAKEKKRMTPKSMLHLGIEIAVYAFLLIAVLAMVAR